MGNATRHAMPPLTRHDDIAMNITFRDNLKFVELLMKIAGRVPIGRIGLGVGRGREIVAASRQRQRVYADGQLACASLVNRLDWVIQGIAGPQIVAIQFVDQDAENWSGDGLVYVIADFDIDRGTPLSRSGG